MNHARGRQLHRAAVREAAHGDLGAAVALQVAAEQQHAIGTVKQAVGPLAAGIIAGAAISASSSSQPPSSTVIVTPGSTVVAVTPGVSNVYKISLTPWMQTNWIVKRHIPNHLIRFRVNIHLPPGVQFHEVVLLATSKNHFYIANSPVSVCALAHYPVELGYFVEVTVDASGRRFIVFADRRCAHCGQFFFAYPDTMSSAPYIVPTTTVITSGPSVTVAVSSNSTKKNTNVQTAPTAYPYATYPPQTTPIATSNSTTTTTTTFTTTTNAANAAAASTYLSSSLSQQPTYPSGSEKRQPQQQQQQQFQTAPPAYSTAPPTPVKSCSKCNAPALSPRAKFCANCGNVFPVCCTKCGAEAISGAKFCMSCGNPIAQ